MNVALDGARHHPVVALVQALIWIPLIVRGERRTAACWSAFDHAAVAGAETVMVPLEAAMYRGGGIVQPVKGNGRIALSSQRLVFPKVTGGVIERADHPRPPATTRDHPGQRRSSVQDLRGVRCAAPPGSRPR